VFPFAAALMRVAACLAGIGYAAWMQLFAAVIAAPAMSRRLGATLAAVAGEAFPELDAGAAWERSDSARLLVVGGVEPPPALAGPRRYRAAADDRIVLYDGLPVDRDGALTATDAAVLLERWEELRGGRLEGQYAALHADLQAGRLEILTDALGLVPVLRAALPGGGWVVANSVEVARRLSGCDAPDPLGAATLLTLGWPAGGRTVRRGIEVLGGGRLHAFGDAGWRERIERVSPALVVPGRLPRVPERELADGLVRIVRAAATGQGPVQCALTGGRDTRVCLALLLAAGVPTDLYTFGTHTDEDVVLARRVAAVAGLSHRSWTPPDGREQIAWPDAAAAFVARMEGMATFRQLPDLIEPPLDRATLGLKLWGAGGEMTRTATGVLDGPVDLVPGVRRSERAAALLLGQKLDPLGGLVRPATLAAGRAYVRDFVARRVAEGWSPGATAEAWYLLERVGRFSASGPRRASTTHDVLSPFCTAPFVFYAYGLPGGERYREVSHHRLLALLAPALLDVPFEERWPSARPRTAAPLATAQLARAGLDLARRRLRRPAPAAAARVPWFEPQLELHRDICLDHAGSPLWELVDRDRLEPLLTGPAEPRARAAAALDRVLTLFWTFHGPRPAAARTPNPKRARPPAPA
jgi:hypothetical protein